jgi:hypothetical protein
MGLLRWLKFQKSSQTDSKLDEWRRAWQAACASDHADGDGRIASLTASLGALGLAEEEIEIEREMLAGLEQLLDLRADVAAKGLPTLETGHRVVGTDRCHFSAPASMPDDPAQPSGRLIFTNARAIFAGGAKATTVPWHAIVGVLQQERDVILVRHDRDTFYRFRCNVFADALAAAFLAKALARRRV